MTVMTCCGPFFNKKKYERAPLLNRRREKSGTPLLKFREFVLRILHHAYLFLVFIRLFFLARVRSSDETSCWLRFPYRYSRSFNLWNHHTAFILVNILGQYCVFLIHFSPVFLFYPSWNHQKSPDLL